MKYLYYIGDSFCGDQTFEDKTFGQLLGDKYNLEVNHAWKGGSSSHRTYRKTLNHIMNNQSKLQDTLFLIGWTKPVRFELYHAIRKKYIQMGHYNFYLMLNNSSLSFLNKDEQPSWVNDFDVSKEFRKEWVLKFLDWDTMLEDHLRRVYSLECILKANNCKYLFWNAFHDTCILHSKLPDVLPLWNKVVEIVDWSNWILPDSSFDEYLKQFSSKEVRQSKEDTHPNDLGHQKWFEVISSIIDDRDIL